MAKSKIIKDIISNEISMSDALFRLEIICTELNNTAILSWINNEIYGYSDKDKLPNYRIINGGHLIYTGFNGNVQATKMPLPLYCLTEKQQNDIKNYSVFESIKQIEESSVSKKELVIDRTILSSQVYKESGIRCHSIYQSLNISSFNDILYKIKHKIIKILVELEKNFGCLDDMDINLKEIESENIKDINDRITQIVYTDNSIKIGNNNKIKNSTIANKYGTKNQQSTSKQPLLIPLIITVVGGIIVGIALKYM